MIEIKNLSKIYSTTPLLKNINLNLSDASTYFLMGKNGTGKTTLIKCILRLEDYTGDILFSGKSLDSIRNEIFVIYDDFPLYGNLNGLQNIHLMLDDSVKFENNDILKLDLLTEKKLNEKVSKYSFSEKKKLSLIAAIIKKPKYLIFDEISNGLDIETLEDLKKHINTLKQHSLILATGHHFEFYENVVDNLLILHDGTITQINDYKKGGVNLHEIYKQYISNC